MKYKLNLQIDFEIPDDWLIRAGATTFKPNNQYYESTSNDKYPTEYMPLDILQAPIRNKGIKGLVEERTLSIITGIINGNLLPPVEVHLKPEDKIYSLKDGYHRFYISVALGYKSLPVSVRPYFDINDF